MNMNYTEELLLNYSDRLDQFLSEIKSINKKNLPEPHLPVLGANYGKKYPKVLFWGWETRNAKSLPEWVKKVKQSKSHAFSWFEESFEDFEFVTWKSNFNQDFWSFNLRILAKLNGLPDWKELYRNRYEYADILSSFAWANTNSIERFEVTAQKLGGCYESWTRLNEAGKIFDSAILIINSIKPDIIVLEHWKASEDWLLEGLKINYKSIPDEHLWYYEIGKPKTHIFWTPHPRGFNKRGVCIEEITDSIVSIYNSRKE